MIGTTLGNYTIQRELGQGGMGAVYVGVHALLGRPAAVKVLLPELSRDQSIVQRFFNEARAATTIRHPGIVEIYDFGFAADGSAYIVMELLAGESLADRLRRAGRLPPALAAQMIRQTASALGAAHQTGIVHRDLKPDNMFLVPDAETSIGERVKLLDFGIAKLADGGPAALARTRAGTIMGTPYYMAPEQCQGAPHLDHRADLYALGCVLYQMLCGEPPFTGEAVGAVLGAHIHLAPPPLRPRAPEVPPELEALVMRLLAKAPDHRPASADALAAELSALGPRLGMGAPSGVYPAAVPAPAWATGAPITTLGGAVGQVASYAPTGHVTGHVTGAATAAPPPRPRRTAAVVAIGGALVVSAGMIVGALALTGRRPPAAAVTPVVAGGGDAGAAIAAVAERPIAVDAEAARQLEAVRAAVAGKQPAAALAALATIPDGSPHRAAAQAEVDALRRRHLNDATLELAGLVDRRRCDAARKVAAAAYDLWGDDAAALTQTAASCRSRDGADAPRPPTPGGGPAPAGSAIGPPSTARGKAVIASLLAAKTGLPECDRYLHALGKYLACDKMPEAARTNMDPDALIRGWRQMKDASIPAESLRQVTDSCRDNIGYIEKGAATLGCPM